MSLSDEQAQFLLDACKLIEYATERGWTVTGGELFRTQEQQEIYFKQGKSKTMQSNHLRRLAIDLNFLRDGKPVYDKAALSELGSFWNLCILRIGGVATLSLCLMFPTLKGMFDAKKET